MQLKVRRERGVRVPDYACLLPCCCLLLLPIDHTSQQAVVKAAWGPQRKAGGKSQTKQANDWAQGTLGKTPKRLGAMVASGVGGAWRTGGWGTRVETHRVHEVHVNHEHVP